MESSRSWHQVAFGKYGGCSGSLAQEHCEASPIWGRAAGDQISLGAFGIAWSKFPILAAPMGLDNGGLAADVGQVAALRQGWSEFAPTQDRETKPILCYEGELFFNLASLLPQARFVGKGMGWIALNSTSCHFRNLKHPAPVVLYSFGWAGLRS